MGDRLGTPGAVGFLFAFISIKIFFSHFYRIVLVRFALSFVKGRALVAYLSNPRRSGGAI